MTGRRISGAGPIALVTIGVVAAFLYSNFLIDWVLSDFTGMGQIVSYLEAPGEPNAMLLRVTDVVCAVLVVTLLPWVRAGLRPGVWRELVVWGTVVFALGAAIAAFVPAPCGPGVLCDGAGQQLQTNIHDGSSIASDTALYAGVAAAWFATRPTGPRWFHRSRLVGLLAGRRGGEHPVRVLQRHRRPELGGRCQPARPHPLHQRVDRLPRRLRRDRGHRDRYETGELVARPDAIGSSPTPTAPQELRFR